MRRIVLLWLVLTPIWIAFSFYASVSKVAFIPPALVVIALVLYWLHKQLVIVLAGEPEPRANPQLSWSLDDRPVAARSRGLVRPALIAVGVGAGIGAAAISFFHLDRAVSDNRMAARAIQPNAAINVQTEAVKSQSFAAEPKVVRTEAESAAAKIQDNATVASSHNPDARRAEAQIAAEGQMSAGQMSANQPRCNVSLCESYYQSFRASDCTYQPFSGPRQYCAR
jgi:hypothetical protein